MDGFLAALQFLTIIPLKLKEINAKTMARSIVYFPLVGLLLGFILSAVNKVLFLSGIPEISANILLVVLLAVLTGGIHLDGLADTADAFLSGKDKEEMLRIMRDPHIGAMGVLSLIFIVLLKVAFLSSLAVPAKTAGILLICLLSRWSMAFLIAVFPYARVDGKAKVFFERANPAILIVTTVITALCVFVIWRIKGLLLLLGLFPLAYLIGRSISLRINGLTGDTLGAINEITEVCVLLFILILSGAHI